MSAPATGGCLCGAVRYKVNGRLRDVLECHCTMCRRTHGHIGAYSAVAKRSLELTEDRGLKWYESSRQARRGFCGTCGGTLFWDPAPSGPAPTFFVLNVSGAFVGTLPTTLRSLTGSVGPGTYTVSVYAANACGNGPATPSQTVTVP